MTKPQRLTDKDSTEIRSTLIAALDSFAHSVRESTNYPPEDRGEMRNSRLNEISRARSWVRDNMT